CLRGGLDPRPIGAEADRQRLEKRNPGSDREISVVREDLARERNAGRLASVRQQFLAQVGKVLGGLGRAVAALAGAVHTRAPALRDSRPQLAEKWRVHLTARFMRPSRLSRA